MRLEDILETINEKRNTHYVVIRNIKANEAFPLMKTLSVKLYNIDKNTNPVLIFSISQKGAFSEDIIENIWKTLELETLKALL